MADAENKSNLKKVIKPLTVREAAEYLHVSVSFLNRARTTQSSPAFYKFGSKVYYELKDLVAWKAARKRIFPEDKRPADGE